MVDLSEMNDEQFDLYRARHGVAEIYRANGFNAFADRIEAGLEDECSRVRIARFFAEPGPEPSPEYIAAWNQFAELDAIA